MTKLSTEPPDDSTSFRNLSGGGKREPDFIGPAWKNPYIIYIFLTLLLFGLLILIGWLAWSNGWIPSRNIGLK